MFQFPKNHPLLGSVRQGRFYCIYTSTKSNCELTLSFIITVCIAEKLYGYPLNYIPILNNQRQQGIISTFMRNSYDYVYNIVKNSQCASQKLYLFYFGNITLCIIHSIFYILFLCSSFYCYLLTKCIISKIICITLNSIKFFFIYNLKIYNCNVQ